MWKDVRDKVIQFYMTLFNSYEREGLEIQNVWHIFTLQYMFMHRIQEELNDFKCHWNNHPLGSENNRSPLQLILLRNCDINYDDPVNLEYFGVDEVMDEELDEEFLQVICEPLISPLSPENFMHLKNQINPLTKHAPVSNLTDRFHFALNIVLELRSAQMQV